MASSASDAIQQTAQAMAQVQQLMQQVQQHGQLVQQAEQELQQQETAERVRRILAGLPAEQSEVVTLKHWEDLTFAEIAEVLGISQNTVASRYRYAMEKLQRSLEGLMQ